MSVLPGAQLAKSGIVSGIKSPKQQIQPAGVDLTVLRIESFKTRPSFASDSLKATMAREAPRRGPTYDLKAGSYRLTFSEVIRLPDMCCGLVLPRSSLLRSGVTVHTALWDPGYRGRGCVLLLVLNRRGATISVGARVAQLVVFQLAHRPHSTYSGRYQCEGLGD